MKTNETAGNQMKLWTQHFIVEFFEIWTFHTHPVCDKGIILCSIKTDEGFLTEP